MKHIVYT